MSELQPTIKVRISAHPIREEQEARLEEPLVELVSEETIVNSSPAITAAVREFAKRHRGVRLGAVSVVRI